MKWTEENLEQLRRMHAAQDTLTHMEARLGRSSKSIDAKLRDIGLMPKPCNSTASRVAEHRAFVEKNLAAAREFRERMRREREGDAA